MVQVIGEWSGIQGQDFDTKAHDFSSRLSSSNSNYAWNVPSNSKTTRRTYAVNDLKNQLPIFGHM